MRRSLELASRMQQALLPMSPLRVPGLNFAWIYEPCDELGGDILNVFPLGHDHVGIYLLDVSGHGVPASLLSVTLSRMLAVVPGQASLVEDEGPHGFQPRAPATVVAELNRRFQMSGTYLQYFTVFYGVLDVARRHLRYVSAGHPPALRLPRDGEASFLSVNSFAVGWFPDAAFEEAAVDLQEGDRLYLYSDGATESMDIHSEQFGPRRLEKACAAARTAPLQQSLNSLTEQIGAFRGCGPQLDDVSMLAVEISGS
jgi:sigma-B regulation protein RsbU (phosphoserine phosphatase)